MLTILINKSKMFPYTLKDDLRVIYNSRSCHLKCDRYVNFNLITFFMLIIIIILQKSLSINYFDFF